LFCAWLRHYRTKQATTSLPLMAALDFNMSKKYKIIIFLSSLFILAGCDGYLFRAEPNIYYADKEVVAKFKARLDESNIPFKISRHSDGKDYIYWDKRYNSKVELIKKEIKGVKLPPGRNMSSGPDTLKYYARVFKENGVKYEMVESYGKIYIVWAEKDDAKAKELLYAPMPADTLN
jgi:hypothetical protein